VLDLGAHQRVYFAGRDAQGRAHIGCFETDLTAGEAPRLVSSTPVLAPGRLGAFDDRGVTTSCLVDSGDALFLYYTGWSLGVTVPFYLEIGLAVSEDGGRSFRRLSEAPVLGRNRHDPFLTASPWVLREGTRWRAWYVSATRWEKRGDEVRHYYNIRHAESDDGIAWCPSAHVCIDYASPAEHAFGRPCVVHDGDRYRMWYCFRGDQYRLGYAESKDGLRWTRNDETAALGGAPEPWESEMQAYPAVSDVRGRRFLLYNGNDYGRTGIGWAEGRAP